MKHERYQGGVIRKRGARWQAEWGRGCRRKRAAFGSVWQARAWLDVRYAEAMRAITIPTPAEILEAKTARDLLPEGVGLIEAARCWLAHAEDRIKSMPVSDCIEAYLDEKAATGLRKKTLQTLRPQLQALASHAANKITFDSVTAEQVAQWLGAHGSGWTRDGYRRTWSAYFAWAIGRKYCKGNPVSTISGLRIDDTEPEIWTPDEAQRLIDACAGHLPELLPWLAISLFAPLRTVELYGLDWQDIDLAGGQIRVRPATAKRRRTRLVPISPNLADILRPRMRQDGLVRPCADAKLSRLRARLARHSGVPWRHNAARHSCLSYLVALRKDVPGVALDSGTSPAMVYRHYRQVVSPSDAARYFGILVRSKRTSDDQNH